MYTSLVFIAAFIICILVFKSVAKFLVRLILVAIVLLSSFGFLYYRGWWPFEDNRYGLDYLAFQYCQEYDDDDICDCIIQEIKSDLAGRFSNEELEELLADRLKGAYALKKSQEATEEASINCLKKRHAEEKYAQFKSDLIPIDNGIIRFLQNQRDTIKEAIRDKVDDVKSKKEEIDGKY
jgi:hypothetical protein